MLNQKRLERIRSRMQEMNLDTLIVTDPDSIAYLCEVLIHPGERFLGLLIPARGKPVLVRNALFSAPPDPALEQVVYTDTDSYAELMHQVLQPCRRLGVDKTMAASFLLPLLTDHFAEEIVNGSPAVDQTRACKSKEEILMMKKASEINDQSLAELKTYIRAGVSEKQLADQLAAIYRKNGAEGLSFPSIISFGMHAVDPHHMPDDTVLQNGDEVLIDVGCIYQGYCSDMTRTYFYGASPSEKLQEIYALVLQANQEAEAMLKPGIPLCEVDGRARQIITDGGYGPYFTHRLGHFIGRQDHEFGDVSGTNRQLTQPGNIFSIEPGIYDPSAGGVRIEDLVLITEDSCEVLNHLPKDLEVL